MDLPASPPETAFQKPSSGGPACHTPRRRWMMWAPLVSMGLLFLAVLAYPGILKSPWGVALVGITAAGCPVMCLGAMALQAIAMGK